MLLIVGLGNPGSEYAGTRHNVGFDVIDLLAARWAIPVRRRALRSVLGTGRVGEASVVLARPMTYMNVSGEAVGAIARMYRIEPSSVIVIVDDIALPTGKLRLRLQGSSGGHHGLESVERHLGTRAYPRVRIGVGQARPGQMVGHVLGRFRAAEREAMTEARERAADAVELAVREGFEQAMNVYNRDPEPGDRPA